MKALLWQSYHSSHNAEHWFIHTCFCRFFPHKHGENVMLYVQHVNQIPIWRSISVFPSASCLLYYGTCSGQSQPLSRWDTCPFWRRKPGTGLHLYQEFGEEQVAIDTLLIDHFCAKPTESEQREASRMKEENVILCPDLVGPYIWWKNYSLEYKKQPLTYKLTR